MRHFISTEDWTQAELQALIDEARLLKAAPFQPLLQNKSIALVFFNPSLRTRTSFHIAFSTLGGAVVDMAAGRDLWPLEFREGVPMDGAADEHVRDALSIGGDVVVRGQVDRHATSVGGDVHVTGTGVVRGLWVKGVRVG